MKTKTTDQSKVLFLKITKFFLFTILSLTFTTITFADDPPLDNPTDDPDTTVPFDGGISILLATGIAYGAKEWFNAKRQMKEQQRIEM